jgi:hypothetical protein
MNVNEDRPNDTRCLCTWQTTKTPGDFKRVFTHYECPVHIPEPRTPQATVLATQARALAAHVEAFNDLVARDTNTHDGKPRGVNWTETNEIGSKALRIFKSRLTDLADLWDFG